LFAGRHSSSAGSRIQISRITSSDSADNTEPYIPGSWTVRIEHLLVSWHIVLDVELKLDASEYEDRER